MRLRRVLGARPTAASGRMWERVQPYGEWTVPASWEVYNAPRPLMGNVEWVGDGPEGNLFAAIDPTDELAEGWRQYNARMDACRVEWVDREVALRQAYQALLDTYPDAALDLDEALAAALEGKPGRHGMGQWLLDHWYQDFGRADA